MSDGPQDLHTTHINTMVENPSKKSHFEPFKHKYLSECKKLLKDELHLCCRAKMDTTKLSN